MYDDITVRFKDGGTDIFFYGFDLEEYEEELSGAKCVITVRDGDSNYLYVDITEDILGYLRRVLFFPNIDNNPYWYTILKDEQIITIDVFAFKNIFECQIIRENFIYEHEPEYNALFREIWQLDYKGDFTHAGTEKVLRENGFL